MSLRRRGASTLMWLALALSGCGNDDAGTDGPLQDGDTSAAQVPSWVLSAAPRFSLTESPSDPDVYFVSPLEGVILEDGSSVIRDGRTTLIYLDSGGSAARIAGGPGGGPGEFQWLSAMLEGPHASGVWTWDSESRRLSRFDRSGEYVTSFLPPVRTGAPPVVGILPGPVFVTIAEPEEGTGAEARRLYALRDSQWTVVQEIEGPREPVSPELTYEVSGRTSHIYLPDGCVPRLEQVVIGNELFAADAASGVIHAFGADGSVREVYRASRRQGVTPEIRTALESRLERGMARNPGREAPADVVREVLRDVRDRLRDQGDQLPAWQRVIADPDGRIWLERPQCPSAGRRDDSFDVVDIEDGQHLGTVTIPDSMTVLAVRGDNVLVRRLGQLDVQHVEMYRLTEAERTSGIVRCCRSCSIDSISVAPVQDPEHEHAKSLPPEYDAVIPNPHSPLRRTLILELAHVAMAGTRQPLKPADHARPHIIR